MTLDDLPLDSPTASSLPEPLLPQTSAGNESAKDREQVDLLGDLEKAPDGAGDAPILQPSVKNEGQNVDEQSNAESSNLTKPSHDSQSMYNLIEKLIFVHILTIFFLGSDYRGFSAQSFNIPSISCNIDPNLVQKSDEN